MYDSDKYSIRWEVCNIEQLPLSLKQVKRSTLRTNRQIHRYYTNTCLSSSRSFNPKGFWHPQLRKKYMLLYYVGLCLYLISNTRWLFPLRSRGRKSIGRIMMLLSVLLPRLYIRCHQFTTEPLDLNPGFYSSALLFIPNGCGCGGGRTCVRGMCAYVSKDVCVCMCVCALL